MAKKFFKFFLGKGPSFIEKKEEFIRSQFNSFCDGISRLKIREITQSSISGK